MSNCGYIARKYNIWVDPPAFRITTNLSLGEREWFEAPPGQGETLEAVSAGAGSLRDFSQCFDSVTLDFSKGLGAPMGGIVVGNNEFVKRSRRIRQAIGGGMRQCGILSAPARAALDDFIGTVSLGEKLRWSHSMARSVADM